MYEYKATVVKIVDGEIGRVDIDLGFGVILKDERVRIMGIDTPESRTRDKVEKQFGLAAKRRLKELLGKHCVLKTQIARDGEDMRGKFGRVLGDFNVYDSSKDAWRPVTDVLVEEGHAVAYFGGNKDEVQVKHMANRAKLIREGVINMSEEQAGLI